MMSDGSGRDDGSETFGADRARRIELIEAGGRRRRWSIDEKAKIVSESFSPGASVSEVARRFSVSLGLLHHWRRQARARAQDVSQSFVPLLPSEEASLERDGGRADTGLIEIELCGANIRVRDGVDGATLAMVLLAVRGS